MHFGYLRIRVTRRRSIFEHSIYPRYYHLIATSAHDKPSIHMISYFYTYYLSIHSFISLSSQSHLSSSLLITLSLSDRSSAPGRSSLYPGHCQIPSDLPCPPIPQALARCARFAARILHRSRPSFRRCLREQQFQPASQRSHSHMGGRRRRTCSKIRR
jgi:hypothetical protein